MPQKLDESGNPIQQKLDESGNPVTESVVKQQLATGVPLSQSQPQKESFLSRAWNTATTPLIPVTEPSIEEWVKSPNWSATRSALAQATTPLNLGLEAVSGLGALAGIGKLRKASKVGQIAKGAAAIPEIPKTTGLSGIADDLVKDLDIRPPTRTELPKEMIDFETGEVLSAPIQSRAPVFNPKGQTGLTGQLQKPRISAAQASQNLKSGGSLLGGKPPNKPPTPPSGGPPELPPSSPSGEPILIKIKDKPPEVMHPIREAWNLSRGLMAVDLPFITSAGFRQALPLAGTRAWIKAWGPSIRSYGSKAFYDAHDAMIKADPLLERKIVPVLNREGKPVIRRDGSYYFKETPSILDKAGVVLPDLKNFSSREEMIRSQLAERIPVWGKVVAASNRSYSAFLKDIRVNAFRNMYEAMPDKNDMVALRELGDAVNTFTGRGKLETKLPFTTFTPSAERHATGLAEVLFAPRLVASRLQMLNPVNYTMTSPQVRKEYMKAMVRLAGAWTTFAGLGKLAGADVTMDPTNADFGKIRIGDVRLDPAGGFQQFMVLLARMGTNRFTSSTSGRSYEMGQGGPFGQTQGSVAANFALNKLHPSLRYFVDAAFASKNTPFHVFDRAAQLAIPMMASDLMEIAQESPELLPILAPLTSAGMGTQYYSGKESFGAPQFIPEEYDIVKGK